MLSSAASTSQRPNAFSRIWQSMGWVQVGLLVAFLLNAVVLVTESDAGFLSRVLYPTLGVAFGVLSLMRSATLSADAALLDATVEYLIRAIFLMVFLIGSVELIVAFCRVEGFSSVALASIRSPRAMAFYVHLPLSILAAIGALFIRGLGFVWFGLLIVVAETMIVVSRFVFSYEQPFMGDLVRYWYAGLLLLSAAYTLKTDGHVRVDVVYSALSKRKKAWVDAFGSIVLGLSFCWIILWFGMGARQSVILSPLANIEVSQSGAAGLYIKYHMAAFLGIFAITLNLQFVSNFFTSLHRLSENEAEPQ